MKKLYTFLLSIVLGSNIYAQNPDDFIITYEVNYITGLQVTYPIYGGTFTIDLGDGSTLTGEDVNNTSVHHVYAAPGIYTIVVSGDFNRVVYGNEGYNMQNKVKSIEQWGTAQWISMEESFKGLPNLIVNATDTPNLSLVTNMKEMFSGATLLNAPINNWDVSNVTNMYALFYNAAAFNQPINNWDVSNVTDMGDMFGRAVSFNQNIDDWNVSNVTNMGGMFGCFPEDDSSFNQPLNSWDVSSVTDMYWMFRDADSFNQPLNNWDVSNVVELGAMFYDANAFNQNINAWNVSSATSMMLMFHGATAFDNPLNDWDMSNVLTIREMFSGASSFNQPLTNWNTSNILEMTGLFHHATSFNQDISNWNFSSVVDLTSPSFGNTFLSYTAMNTSNYDALLLAFAQSGLQNKTLIAEDVFYCDGAVRSYLINDAGWTIIADQLSGDCFEYSLVGSTLFDVDTDGCDVEDLPVNGFIVSAINNNFDYGTTIIDGSYNLNLIEGSYDVSILNSPAYFDISPVATSVTLDTNNTSQIVDFCVTANQAVNDLTTTLLPITQARPGFQAQYQLIIQNQGTETINNVSTSLNFDDTKQNFVSSIPPENSTTVSTVFYNLGTLQPFETVYLDITMQTFAPPSVNANDILNFSAVANPVAGDETPDTNTYTLAQIVVNSLDPNEKQVMQGDKIFVDEINQYLDYIIRFQNTGTESAINVRLLDILDEKLEVSTFLPISASHDYTVRLINGNEVEFLLNGINLPHQTANETESHGYIAFKIKPKSNVQVGDIITGNASIYFDYNAPILTNTVQTQIVPPLGISENENTLSQIKIYPSPADNILNIIADKNTKINELSIYTIQGIKIQSNIQGQDIIDVSSLSSGIYFINISTTKGTVIRKWIKK